MRRVWDAREGPLMVCGTCGATIADRAIACYRCGAATAAEPARPAGRVTRAWGPLLAAITLTVGLGWMAAASAPGSVQQIGLAVAGAVTAALAGVFARGRRRS